MERLPVNATLWPLSSHLRCDVRISSVNRWNELMKTVRQQLRLPIRVLVIDLPRGVAKSTMQTKRGALQQSLSEICEIAKEQRITMVLFTTNSPAMQRLLEPLSTSGGLIGDSAAPDGRILLTAFNRVGAILLNPHKITRQRRIHTIQQDLGD